MISARVLDRPVTCDRCEQVASSWEKPLKDIRELDAAILDVLEYSSSLALMAQATLLH
jgi:hypothetical protein